MPPTTEKQNIFKKATALFKGQKLLDQDSGPGSIASTTQNRLMQKSRCRN